MNDDYDDNTPVSLRIIGAQIKGLREARSWTQDELGKKVGYSGHQIRSVERGRRKPKPDLLMKAEEVFGVPGVFTSVIDELLKESHPTWFEPYAEAEAEAVALSAYDSQLVRGLLQTEEYARAVHVAYRPALTDEEIETRVTARMARQQLLTRTPAPALSFILEEHVLKRPIGSRKVLRAQLHHLLEVGQMRHIDIQVMPLDCTDHAGLEGPFTLVEPASEPMCAYLEVQGNGKLITERRKVNNLVRKYGILQSQALTTAESAQFIQKLATGER